MTALATVTDLANRLGIDPNTITSPRLEQWTSHLEDASEAITDAVGCAIALSTSTITQWVGDIPISGSVRPLRPTDPYRFLVRTLAGSQEITLPAVPIVSVGSITDQYGPVEYELVDSHRLRVWAQDSLLTITYMHGWATIPNELKRWTLVLAASSLQAAADGNLGMAGGLSSVRIADGAVAFAASAPGSAVDIPDTVRARLHATYGPSTLEIRDR